MGKIRMKKNFYDIIKKRPQKANSFQMSTTKYLKLIDEVKVAKSGNKENRHYWLLKHYDVVSINTKEKLIVPSVNDQVLYYVVLEDLFDILYETHTYLKHGGRDRMKKELQQRYKNITVQDIQTFLNLCELCLQKRKCEKKESVVQPTFDSNFNSRCQVDLIDFQSQADGEYNFIMVYRDHLTKFVILKALKSNQTVEVSEQLLNIFLLFGAPSILQSDNGLEFVNKIIENLKKLWPELKIIHGEAQSQNSVECVRQDIENILNSWMLQEACNNWSKLLGFVQFMKNRALHTEIKKTPYEAMFGQPAKIGLDSSTLSVDIIRHINTEEDIEKVLQKSKIHQEDSSQQINISSTTEIVVLENSLQEDSLNGHITGHELLEDMYASTRKTLNYDNISMA